MKTSIAILVLGFFAAFSPAMAADRAVVLNDQEMAALHHVLDLATKSGDTKDARITVYFLNKLDNAPVVTDQKADEPKEAPK